MRTFSRVLLLSSCVLSTLPAQGTGLRDQPIPRELVEGLLAPMSGRTSPLVVVGELPPALKDKLFVPSTAKVLGGMYSNALSIAILVSPASAESLAVAFRRELPKLGWTYLDRSTLMGGDAAFRDSPSSTALGSPSDPIMYCGAGTTLTIQIDARGLTESRISATSSGNNMCAMMRDQARTGRMYDRGPRAPTLMNPPSARGGGYGTCETGNFSSSGGGGPDLSSTMTPEEILNHYGRQLADSGWKQTPATGMSRSWTKTDSTGVTQEYEITIKSYGPGSTCRRLRTEMNSRR